VDAVRAGWRRVSAGKGKVDGCENEDYILLENRFIPTEELASFIKYAEFTVCPYRSATQSGVVSTAFAMCSPILATNVGGMSESIKDGITGILIEPENVDLLSDAIIKLCQNPDFLERMKINIKREITVGDFSWSAIANIYQSIYNE
jgi:glycosyltransferase involved in cell wall biosynthesis